MALRRRGRTLLAAGLGALLLGLGPLLGPAPAAPAASTPSSPYAPTLRGHVVRFTLHGLEPDFDPIYGIVLVLTLHDARPAPAALPDATLVLDLYLESFQPDTTPLLPDLLHPNQTAAHLAGFMQGQAVLVNRGGQVAYQGDALAEVFADSTVHLVLLNLQRPGAPASAPQARLRGVLTLYKGGTQTGHLVALGPLARAALAVPRGQGQAPSWQRVVAGLRVALPPMRGTAGGQPPAGTVTPSSHSVVAVATAVADAAPRPLARAAPASLVPALGVAALLIVLGAGLLWRTSRRSAPDRT